ncbi:GAF domain-containing protein [Halolamina sp. CBA1230]|uniref:bacterio-opsin activator domain-containing protein n=1 Tax=Halolamina sp. CBA1230 TaxID=1853690 RepID=UPI0009A22172|nr:bacterio-opsin activator domain-containing protein [Halolamina sp. CBA1230]QKY20164.1 GAF domain-containing protein [Halolamina sp. CBA1230]
MPSADSILHRCHLLLVGDTPWLTGFADALERRTAATVDVEPGAAAALDRFRQADVDCVLGAQQLADGSGVELLATIQEETPAFPLVLGARDGSERLASDAIAAGVTDYVPIDGTGEATWETLFERLERALWSARHTATQRDRARQFEAVFQDSRTATWVLDVDGELLRVNRTARGMTDASVEETVGEPFWSLPYWDDATGRDVRRLVERGAAGEFGDVVVVDGPASADRRVIELSVHPVEDERGTVVSLVVEGLDVSERVRLERDLRRSEKLHRATLKYMTDTVLLTDEAGEYEYVCPNVHFIFGYTAEEIRADHPIEELLGDDLFDREELAAEGVLKNIECTVTDEAGREHTLLVNVREVSIQDGRILYTCRDITTRKQREQALTTLQGTAREFLYAETPGAIARHVVDDTADVLGLDAAAVYLYDADENALRPESWSAAVERLHGPPSTVRVDADSPVNRSFVGEETLRFADVHDAHGFDAPASDLRQAAFVPLGDHGVLVVGSAESRSFDDVTVELVDLLAATAEAALDRVERESRLRRQERELQQHNSRLAQLNRINETIRGIDQALVRSETREEIERGVCERLAGDDRFPFAWIGTADPQGDSVEPRQWAGDGGGYLDSRSFPVREEGAEPAGRAAATGEPAGVDDVADDLRQPWRKDALAREFRSSLSVPLRYNDLSYGVLTVYADERDAFDGMTRSVVAELGETVAAAISATERKNALLSPSRTRLQFAVDDPSFVLARLARRADCTLTYRGGVRQTMEGNDVFVAVENGDADAVETAAAELVAVSGIKRITTEGARSVLRLRFADQFLALELADHGAVFHSATATPTGTTLTVDVPENVDTRSVSALITDELAEVELRSKRTLDDAADPYAEFLDRLTERQFEVLQTAYYSGYFESPRASSGETVAETLDISPQAFYRHVRTVQRKLFDTLFDDASDGGVV